MMNIIIVLCVIVPMFTILCAKRLNTTVFVCFNICISYIVFE